MGGESFEDLEKICPTGGSRQWTGWLDVKGGKDEEDGRSLFYCE